MLQWKVKLWKEIHVLHVKKIEATRYALSDLTITNERWGELEPGELAAHIMADFCRG